MNVLITRPLIETEDLMGKLFSFGHKIIHIPTLKISATGKNLDDVKKYVETCFCVSFTTCWLYKYFQLATD